MILENVEGFDVSYVKFIMHAMYNIIVCHISPADVCFNFVKRPRVYIIFLHRQKVRLVHDIEGVIRFVCLHMRSATNVLDAMISDASEACAGAQFLINKLITW